MALHGVANLPADAVAEADGIEFKVGPGIVMVSAPGLEAAETVNVQVHIGGGEWVPVYDVLNGEPTPQMTDSLPYHFFSGGGRYRAYKSETTVPISLKVQYISVNVQANK